MDLTELKQGPKMESFVNIKKMSLRDIHKEDMGMKKSKKRKASDPSGWLFHISIKVEFCLMKSTTYHRIGVCVEKCAETRIVLSCFKRERAKRLLSHFLGFGGC